MKKFKILFLILIVFVFLTVNFSCSMRRGSIGSHDKILVVADSTLWLQLEDVLKAALERTTFTPQPEKVFNLLQKNPDDLRRVTRHPNILVLGTLQSEGKMKELVDKLLSAESVKRIKADDAFLFQKKDPWALDQILTVMVSNDVGSLKNNIVAQSDKIFDVFDKFNEAYTHRTIFSQFEQKTLQKELMSKHNWSVRVPHDYHVAVDSSEFRFVWLRRFDPQRWFAAYWETVDDPSLLSKEWLLEKRADISEKYYDGDYVYQDSLITVRDKVVDFNGRYALRLDGVWQNEKHIMGGPFRIYGFYNESDSRIYMIDLAVYAPGKFKYPFLRQLDAMAHTFKSKTKNQGTTE